MEANTTAKSEKSSNVASAKRRKRTWSAPSSTVYHLHVTDNENDVVRKSRSVQKCFERKATEKEEWKTLRVKWITRELTRLFPSRSCNRRVFHNQTSTVKHECNKFLEQVNNVEGNIASLTKNDSVLNMHESKDHKRNGEVIEKSDTTLDISKCSRNVYENGHENEKMLDENKSCQNYGINTNGMKTIDAKNVLENTDAESKQTVTSIDENSICNSCDNSKHNNLHSNSDTENNNDNEKEILLMSSNANNEMEVEKEQRKIEISDVTCCEETLQSEENVSETKTLKAKLEMTLAQVQLSNAVIERNINNWNVIEKENKWLKEENCTLKKKIEELKYELNGEKSKVKEQINIIRTLQRELNESKKEEKSFSSKSNLNNQNK